MNYTKFHNESMLKNIEDMSHVELQRLYEIMLHVENTMQNDEYGTTNAFLMNMRYMIKSQIENE